MHRNNQVRLAGFQFVSMIGLFTLFSGCERKSENVWPDKPGKKVLTTFAPLQCFALNVAGDDAIVKVILTSEGAHHHGDPAPQHLKLAAKADVLFYNGLLLDDGIARRLHGSGGNPNLPIVALGEKIPKDERLEGACHHDHAPGEAHDHGDDPHVWLGPKHAQTMVAAIRDQLKSIDPEHAAGYESRAAAYIAKLEQLEKDGLAMLKDCTDNKLLTHHDSLAYFADAFKLRIIDFIQTADVEPGSEQLNKIIKSCKKFEARVIAVEPQYNRNTAAAVIKAELEKAGIKPVFVEVDTLEAANEADITPDYYERKMRANLENLAKALR